MRVSVIIPCFNDELFIGETLESLLRQSKVPDEIIVVDDASTDRSVAVARSFNHQVRVIVQEINKGACEARNIGAKVSTGDFLMFLDSDDLVNKETIRSLHDTLVSGTGIAACPWKELWWHKKEKCWHEIESRFPYRSSYPFRAWLTNRWYVPSCSIMWERDFFFKTGMWDSTLARNQDGDIMLRALQKTQLSYSETGCGFYRRHRVNQGKRISKIKRISAIVSSMNILAKYLPELNKCRQQATETGVDISEVYWILATEAWELGEPELMRKLVIESKRYGEGKICARSKARFLYRIPNFSMACFIHFRVLRPILNLLPSSYDTQ